MVEFQWPLYTGPSTLHWYWRNMIGPLWMWQTEDLTFQVLFLTPHLPNVLSGLFVRREINPTDMENIPCYASGSEIIRAFRQMEESVLTQRIFSVIYLYSNTRNYCYFKKAIKGYFNLYWDVILTPTAHDSPLLMKTSLPSCPVRELGESALCWSTVVTVPCRLLLVPRTAAAGTVTPPPPGKRRAGWHLTGENVEHVAAPWLKAWQWGLKCEREANVPARVQVSASRHFCWTAGRKVTHKWPLTLTFLLSYSRK